MTKQGDESMRPTPAVGQRWRSNGEPSTEYVITGGDAKSGWAWCSDGQVDKADGYEHDGAYCWFSNDWFKGATFLGPIPITPRVDAGVGPMGETKGLPVACLACGDGPIGVGMYHCEACYTDSTFEEKHERRTAWDKGARDFPRRPAAPVVEPAPRMQGLSAWLPKPDDPCVVPAIYRYGFGTPQPRIYLGPDGGAVDAPAFNAGRTLEMDYGKPHCRIENCGEFVASPRSDGMCEKCLAHVMWTMDAQRKAPALFPASKPPGRFHQSHTGGFVGIISLRDERR